MSQHRPPWSAQEELDLLVAVCRANGCFKRTKKSKWDGVVEYFTKKGHDRTTIAIQARFNRIIKPTISKEPVEDIDEFVPCKTMGRKPLLFSIPSWLLSDVDTAVELQFPALEPDTLKNLEIKTVKLSSNVGLAQYVGHDVLPTRVGAITLDGSFRAFLVNRDALHGAKELSYKITTGASRPAAPGGDANDDVFGGGFGVAFPGTSCESQPGGSNNAIHPPDLSIGVHPDYNHAVPCANPFINTPDLASQPQPQLSPRRKERSPCRSGRSPFSTPRRPNNPSWFPGTEGEAGEDGDPSYLDWLREPIDSPFPFYLSPGSVGSPVRTEAEDHLALPQMDFPSCPHDCSPRKCGDGND